MLSIFLLAKQYDARVLEAAAGNFIKKNTTYLRQSLDLLENKLTKKQLVEIMKVLCDN